MYLKNLQYAILLPTTTTTLCSYILLPWVSGKGVIVSRLQTRYGDIWLCAEIFESATTPAMTRSPKFIIPHWQNPSQHNPSRQNPPIIMSFREGKWQNSLKQNLQYQNLKTKSARTVYWQTQTCGKQKYIVRFVIIYFFFLILILEFLFRRILSFPFSETHNHWWILHWGIMLWGFVNGDFNPEDLNLVLIHCFT